MTWMEMDYSKDMHFRWKIKWQLEDLGVPLKLALMYYEKGFLPAVNFCMVPLTPHVYTTPCVVQACPVIP